MEQFVELNSLKELKETNSSLNYEIFFNEIVETLKELQRIEFLHLDLTPNNIYFNNKKIFIIDFGFSKNNNDNDLSYIGNKNKIKFVSSHINEFSRLEKGYIDDAISLLEVCFYMYPAFISDFNDKWNEINNMTNKIFFDFRTVKNENKKDKKPQE